MIGTILTGLTLPFAVGEVMEVADRAGLDATGERARAGRRLSQQINQAGWSSILNAQDGPLSRGLETLLSQVRAAGPESRQWAGRTDSGDFLEQLFAREGMRLNSIGAEAKRMSYLDMAAQQGLIG